MKASSERLVELIHNYQQRNPANLLPRKYVVSAAAPTLCVAEQTIRKYLTDEVANGTVLEILPRSDWKVTLPGGDDLPTLYVAPTRGRTYSLEKERPHSRGAGNLSFMTVPGDLEILLARQRERFGLPQREPGAPVEYDASVQRRVDKEAYDRAVIAVHKSSMNGLGPAGATMAVNAVLEQLNLLPPQY